MNGWADYRLAEPWYLLLALAVLVALIVGWRRRLPSLLVPSLLPLRSPTGRLSRGAWPLRLPLLIEAAGLLLLTIALARPQHGNERTPDTAEGIDIILAIDISGSMNAIDLAGDLGRLSEADALTALATTPPRLDIAKRELQRFIDQRENDRIGLIAFASHTYTMTPLTFDDDFLKQQVKLLDPSLLEERQTNLAAPIASATERLRESAARRRVVVLFTDGQNTYQERITPIQAAEIARTFGIVVHTVGIGGEQAFAELQPGRWVPQPGSYDEPTLRRIAEMTGGRFFSAADEAGFREVMTAIDLLEKTEIERPRYLDYSDRFLPWLWAGLGCLLLAVFLEHSLLLKVP